MTSQPDEFNPGADDTAAQRRRADGTRSSWLLRETSGHVALTKWDRGPSGEWSISHSTSFSSLRDALQEERELVTLRVDEETTYNSPDTDLLLKTLAIEDASSHEEPQDIDWPFDIDGYLGDDEDFYGGDGLVRRYARLNGERLQLAECAEGGHIAFRRSEDNAVGSLLAEFRYGNDVGAGGFTLTRTSAQSAVAIARGDACANVAARGFEFHEDPAGTAELIHDWVAFTEYFYLGPFGAAAIALEPLDPAGQLSPSQLEDWRNCIDGVDNEYGDSLHMTFALDANTKAALRKRLRANETYRTVADALADPVLGEWLRIALSEGDFTPLR